MKEWWDAMAPVEETDRDDEAMNRALRWRVIERHLEGVETILDVGGGTGAFSIPLARKGFKVTHVDISPAMLERARANAGDLAIEFRSDFEGQFDLVLNFDGPISFAGAGWREVLAASAAATRKTLIVSVSNRASLVATLARYSLRETGGLVPAVDELLRTGLWDAKQFPENARLHPLPMKPPTLKAFTRAELHAAIEATGLEVAEVRAIGSLAHLLVPGTGLSPDLCEAYDLAFPEGPGSFRRAGLLGVASAPTGA